MSYNLISKYRTELMGLAIIWIFLFHSKISFPDHFIFHPLRLIFSTGYGGVDIFFFLSGFGLMHHMLTRNSSYLAFYKNRFIRILPAYFLATSITFLVDYFINGTISIKDFLLCLSTIGFWTNHSMFYWFIPSIIALYLMYPLFFQGYLKYRLKLVITVASLSILACLLLFLTGRHHFIIFFSRIPLFILGSHIGYLSLNNETEISINEIYLHLGIFFSFVILLSLITLLPGNLAKNSGLRYYIFGIGTFPACLLASMLCEQAALYYKNSLSLFLFCGSISLEIYLVHKQIVFNLGELFLSPFTFTSEPLSSIFSSRLLEYFFYFIITLLFALQLHKFSKYILIQLDKTLTKIPQLTLPKSER